MSEKKFWCLKSEPSTYSIDDLAKQPKKTDHWDGVRNYQARNFMRDQMQRQDEAFFYHSNTKIPGIVGICRVVRCGYPDHTAFDPDDPHFDPKSDPDNPRWYMVDVQLVRKFKRTISLTELKTQASLKKMQLLQKGNRLSVCPVSAAEWQWICSLE